MTLFAVENGDPTELPKRFTFLGTDFYTTRLAWLNMPLMIVVGIILSLLFMPAEDFTGQLITGIIFGILIILAMFIHTLGHLISSKMVNAPVVAVIMTVTVNYLNYGEDGSHPSRVHIGRSLGGPILNIITALIMFILYAFVLQSHFIAFFGGVNLALAIVTLSPLPSLDGAVVIREMRDWKS